MIRENIQALVEGINLTCDESQQTMREIMSGQATNAQIAAFLTALRMKGETVQELVAFAEVMRENCCSIHPKVEGRLVDTCGTGGDRLKTFNISTAAAFVAAGSGVAIAKHGNRAVTSRSGSADVLELLGVKLNVEPSIVSKEIEQAGIGFMFAPAFHPAMKYAVAARKEVGIRTIFNLLGPLTNPACANAQVLGVYDQKLTFPVAQALRLLGCKEAMVVHGQDGLDEISTVGKTVVSHLREGEIKTFEAVPGDFGITQSNIEDLQGETPQENAKILFQILSGKACQDDPKSEIVLVNSAAAIIVGGKAPDFKCGVQIALESLRSGAAYKKLGTLIKVSGGDLSKLEELEQKYD
jgi:anthranilate phosphoribosyltransferase